MMDAVDGDSLESSAEVRYRKNTICFVELYFVDSSDNRDNLIGISMGKCKEKSWNNFREEAKLYVIMSSASYKGEWIN